MYIELVSLISLYTYRYDATPLSLSGAQCWCASLDDCTKSSPLMVEIFERVGQEVPNVLKEMAVKELEVIN